MWLTFKVNTASEKYSKLEVSLQTFADLPQDPLLLPLTDFLALGLSLSFRSQES